MLLQPLVKRLDSYLRDTKHVLQLLERVTWEGRHLSWATVDVVSLYSYILHERGIEAVKYHMSMYSNYDDVTNNFILEALKYLLMHNFFKFDSTFYFQRCGTLMGGKFAPTYANLFTGWWEETHIFGGISHDLDQVHFYKRYVDDLLFIWTGTENDFIGFIQSLNVNDCNLKFTITFGCSGFRGRFTKGRISRLTHEGTKVVSTVYRKETAGNSLLRAGSCYPRHVFRAIPFGQFQRLRLNCSTDTEYLSKSLELRDCFLARGYPLASLEVAFTKALRQDRLNLISDRKKVVTVVSKHFLECNGSDIRQLKIQGIEKIESSVRGGDLTAKLFHREAFWIFTLGTRQPAGLNLKFDIACCV
ncbi:hypothetical protein XELAEV_18028656mg [Xenopus laevis]|uniref:Reverse transcriptase domain-containing protein n=1 Tax=Xenopus laevis TaxID=8355 RepID=A0A974CPZ6_XENLA|nr:hypothetical protein XELAEV_18028656mg [Xenopus laevis]